MIHDETPVSGSKSTGGASKKGHVNIVYKFLLTWMLFIPQE